MINIGIIGTAGRKDDYDKLNYDNYFLALEQVAVLILDKCNRTDGTDDVCLISGGAAWADHIAVLLYLSQPDLPFKVSLKLYMPTSFDVEQCRFEERDEKFDVGKTTNYYHKKFSDKINGDSRRNISDAIKAGASFTNGFSFKARNTMVAKNCDVMVALTFGKDAKLKDGGTMDTMKKFQSLKGNKETYHIDLHTLKMFNPAEIE